MKTVYDFLDRLAYHPNYKFTSGLKDIRRIPIVPIIIIGILGFLTIQLIVEYFSLNVWRHDAFIHTPEQSWYFASVKETGRWIIYYLFDVVKLLPPAICATINLICLFAFGFLITRSIQKDYYISAIIGFLFILPPVLHAQNLWPQTSLSAFILLPLMFYLSRRVHPYVFFPIAAVLFFGTLSNYYFLMPLVYLGYMYDNLKGEWKHDVIFTFIKILLPYVLAFVVGYLITNGITYLVTGQTIVLGEWRGPKTITDFDSFLVNFDSVNQRIWKFLSSVKSEYSLVVVVAAFIMFLLGTSKKIFWTLLVVIVVFLSPFYTTIYHGIFISNRSLTTSFVVVLIPFVLLSIRQVKFNNLHALLCLAVAYPLYTSSKGHLNLFSHAVNYCYEEVRVAMEDFPPSSYPDVVIFAEDKEVGKIERQIMNRLDQRFEWCESLGKSRRLVIPQLRALGYRNIYTASKEQMQAVEEQAQKRSPVTNTFLPIRFDNNANLIGLRLNDSELKEYVFIEL